MSLCELGEFLNGRGWFRAGGTVSLGKESQGGQVEQASSVRVVPLIMPAA